MGLEEYVCFKESISRCPNVPWNIEPEHLEAIDKKVKELEEQQKEKLWYWSPSIIRRSEERYFVLLEKSKSDYYGRATQYDLAFFHEASFIDVVPLASLACNSVRLKKEICSENKKEYEDSPYMHKLNWNCREIPIDRRSIKELQETGASITPLTKDHMGIPVLYSERSEEYLRSRAFCSGANAIVGYKRTFCFDNEFPFIHPTHGGYPVIIKPTSNP